MHTSKLLVRLPNWVGDVCMVTPTLYALKSCGLNLHLVGKAWSKDLFSGTDWPVSTINKKLFASAKVFREIDAQNMLLFPDSLSSALMGKLAGKKCFGCKADCRSLFLSAGIRISRPVHQVECYWNLGKACAEWLGVSEQWPDSIPEKIELPLSAAAKQQSESILKDLPKSFIIVAPLVAGLFKGQSKVWPHWQELGEQLQEKNIAVVTCPGPGEAEETQKILPHAICLENVSLSTLGVLMQRAQLTLGNDSGQVHLANAVGAKHLAIYGVSDPKFYGPWGGSSIGGVGCWPGISELLQPVFGVR